MIVFTFTVLIITAAFTALLIRIFIPAGAHLIRGFFRIIRAGLMILLPMAVIGFGIFMLCLII